MQHGISSNKVTMPKNKKQEYYSPDAKLTVENCRYQRNICSIREHNPELGRTVFRQPWKDCSCPAHAVNNIKGRCIVNNVTDLARR